MGLAQRAPSLAHARSLPPAKGSFICQAKAGGRELVQGQWGVILFFAKTAALPYATNNARFEELASKASFKGPWAHGQRCVIPAVSFDEPCWETGRNVWHRFGRAVDPCGAARADLGPLSGLLHVPPRG